MITDALTNQQIAAILSLVVFAALLWVFIYPERKVVTIDIPWYRHNIFPWGWVDIREINPEIGDVVTAQDYYSESSQGIVFYKVAEAGTGTADGGTYIDINVMQLKAQYSELQKDSEV